MALTDLQLFEQYRDKIEELRPLFDVPNGMTSEQLYRLDEALYVCEEYMAGQSVTLSKLGYVRPEQPPSIAKQFDRIIVVLDDRLN